MNIKEIKQILVLIKEYGLAEFELEREGEKLCIKKYSQAPQVFQPPVFSHYGEQAVRDPQKEEASKTAVDKKSENTGLKNIISPIVGTYYAAPAPDAAPFVSVSTKVSSNDTVCIIEAMKVMNEIKAEINGVIEEVCVQNGQAVEFGQVLFKVRPL